MLWSIFAFLLLACLAPLLHRALPRQAGTLLALAPAAVTVYLLLMLPQLQEHGHLRVAYPWAPTLHLQLSFYLDGLSFLFAFLITGIGALILLYTGAYLRDDPQQGRFLLYLMLFMGSMLGTVLADNLITLFIFWEGTTIASFLLIGYKHRYASARDAAMQALVVTGGGGLALLVGLLLLAQVTGSYELSEIARGAAVQEHALYLPILLLVLVGAFTKSAQWPFHFWLPNAMAAPTPASAYLHSSTMVKAGIYLLARLHPTLGGTDAWYYLVAGAGAITMVVAGCMTFHQREFKPLLAYTTLIALGLLTCCLGIGTEAALMGALIFLMVHAFYKAALFLVAGAVDHQVGTMDAEVLGRLSGKMPLSAMAAALAAVSMAGVPPFLGFIGKEATYEAVLHAPLLAVLLTAAAFVGNTGNVYAALMIGWRPFWGRKMTDAAAPGEASPALWLPSLLLGVGGLVLGGLAAWFGHVFIAPGAHALIGHEVPVHLVLWHGFTPVLGLSVATLLFGTLLYTARAQLRAATRHLLHAETFGPLAWYYGTLRGITRLARAQHRVIQHGYLRAYLKVILAFCVLVPGYALLTRSSVFVPPKIMTYSIHHVGLAAIIIIAAVYAVLAKTRLSAVAALGVVGYGVALVFVFFGAPDVAMTQFVVETLTVLLFVLVLYRMPPYRFQTSPAGRVRDLAIAAGAAGFLTMLVFLAIEIEVAETVSSYYMAHSASEAHGRNVVNVILVDFRALDTLGEIIVLSVSALGIFGLLRLRIKEEKQP